MPRRPESTSGFWGGHEPPAINLGGGIHSSRPSDLPTWYAQCLTGGAGRFTIQTNGPHVSAWGALLQFLLLQRCWKYLGIGLVFALVFFAWFQLTTCPIEGAPQQDPDSPSRVSATLFCLFIIIMPIWCTAFLSLIRAGYLLVIGLGLCLLILTYLFVQDIMEIPPNFLMWYMAYLSIVQPLFFTLFNIHKINRLKLLHPIIVTLFFIVSIFLIVFCWQVPRLLYLFNSLYSLGVLLGVWALISLSGAAILFVKVKSINIFLLNLLLANCLVAVFWLYDEMSKISEPIIFLLGTYFLFVVHLALANLITGHVFPFFKRISTKNPPDPQIMRCC